MSDDEPTVRVRCALDSQDASNTPGLKKFVQAAIRRVIGEELPTPETEGPYWGAAHFSLSKVSAFVDASDDERDLIIAELSRLLVEEAFYIEKAGMAFASKMALLSESTEERMLYCLFGAEEASHLAMIAAFMKEAPAPARTQPFLGFLGELIETGERQALLLCVQVLLEGWGIQHYYSLAEGCQDKSLKAALVRILADEGRHHGSGVLLCDPSQLGRHDSAALLEALRRLYAMIQVGPQAVVGAIARHCGGLTQRQRQQAFQELDAEGSTRRKLAQLDALMAKTRNTQGLREALRSDGLLEPWDCARCAAVLT